MAKIYDYIFWDWHGVLGLRGFWNLTSKTNAEVDRVANLLFSDREKMKGWMRGDLLLNDLLKTVNTNLTEDDMVGILKEDWSNSDAINKSLFSAISSIYPKAKHVIITDNMDIFSKYSEDQEFLNDKFDYIFNSSEVKLLKDDTPGLFEHAMSTLKLASFSNCLLLDDSPTNCERFELLGGESILVARNL